MAGWAWPRLPSVRLSTHSPADTGTKPMCHTEGVHPGSSQGDRARNTSRKAKVRPVATRRLSILAAAMA